MFCAVGTSLRAANYPRKIFLGIWDWIPLELHSGGIRAKKIIIRKYFKLTESDEKSDNGNLHHDDVTIMSRDKRLRVSEELK